MKSVFHRLHLSTTWLKSFSSSVSEDINLRNELCYFCPAECARYALQWIESMDYFMLDMKNRCLIRHRRHSRDIGSDSAESTYRAVCIDCTGASLSWVAIQVSFAMLTNNETVFVIPDSATAELLRHSVSRLMSAEEENSSHHNPITFTSPSLSDAQQQDLGADHSLFFSYTPLQVDAEGLVVVPSILPSLDQILCKEVQTLPYLQQKYGAHITELMDEFDLLSNEERDIFVAQRSFYLLGRIRESSTYYSRTLSSNLLNHAPIINGQTLLEHVHPYGQTLLSSAGHVHTPAGHDGYAVAFASGGSTGRMKFVYRSEWEDQENARYLGKGLYAAGVHHGDVVVNFLSAGFWGGMHVFNLALSYTGCSVIPLGPTFSCAEVLGLLRQLQPTAVLAMPSFVMALADFQQTQLVGEEGKGGVVIKKVITGGEMLLPEMEKRIQDIFQVEAFLSTGYTSNETGAIGFRCAHLPPSHFHVHENMQHISLSPLSSDVSEKDSAPSLGETGKIIATNLNRTLMPLVRYEIGDMGAFVPQNAASIATTRGEGESAGEGAEQGGGVACLCGRRLRVLRLLGRCDSRIRLGTEDLLYLEELPRCLRAANDTSAALLPFPSGAPRLTLSVGCFSLEVTKSARMFDHLTVHVEATSLAAWKNGDERRRMQRALIEAIGRHTQLVWEVRGVEVAEGGQEDAGEVENAMFVHMMTKKRKLSEACIEMPVVIVHAPGDMPRNPRTGKIVLMVDKR